MATDHARLLRDLRKQGFALTQAKRGTHWHVRKDGRLVAVLACSPGKGRAYENALAQLKRAGFQPNR